MKHETAEKGYLPQVRYGTFTDTSYFKLNGGYKNIVLLLESLKNFEQKKLIFNY